MPHTLLLILITKLARWHYLLFVTNSCLLSRGPDWFLGKLGFPRPLRLAVCLLTWAVGSCGDLWSTVSPRQDGRLPEKLRLPCAQRAVPPPCVDSLRNVVPLNRCAGTYSLGNTRTSYSIDSTSHISFTLHCCSEGTVRFAAFPVPLLPLLLFRNPLPTGFPLLTCPWGWTCQEYKGWIVVSQCGIAGKLYYAYTKCSINA